MGITVLPIVIDCYSNIHFLWYNLTFTDKEEGESTKGVNTRFLCAVKQKSCYETAMLFSALLKTSCRM